MTDQNGIDVVVGRTTQELDSNSILNWEENRRRLQTENEKQALLSKLDRKWGRHENGAEKVNFEVNQLQSEILRCKEWIGKRVYLHSCDEERKGKIDAIIEIKRGAPLAGSKFRQFPFSEYTSSLCSSFLLCCTSYEFSFNDFSFCHNRLTDTLTARDTVHENARESKSLLWQTNSWKGDTFKTIFCDPWTTSVQEEEMNQSCKERRKSREIDNSFFLNLSVNPFVLHGCFQSLQFKHLTPCDALSLSLLKKENGEAFELQRSSRMYVQLNSSLMFDLCLSDVCLC